MVELARDLIHDYDDDKEHFWVILLNTQNHYLLAQLVSTGTQIPQVTRHSDKIPGSRGSSSRPLSGWTSEFLTT